MTSCLPLDLPFPARIPRPPRNFNSPARFPANPPSPEISNLVQGIYGRNPSNWLRFCGRQRSTCFRKSFFGRMLHLLRPLQNWLRFADSYSARCPCLGFSASHFGFPSEARRLGSFFQLRLTVEIGETAEIACPCQLLGARTTRYGICLCILSFLQILNSKFYIINSLTRYYTISLVMCPRKSKRTTIFPADFADFTDFWATEVTENAEK